MRRILGLLLLPLIWAVSLPAAIVASVLDLLATPIVWLARLRRREADRPPVSRDASVLVLSYNGRDWLEDLLPGLRVAVQRAPGDHEVVVVDNGSDDGTEAWLAAEHDWVRVVRLPANRFFVGGMQAGIASTTHDILVLVNNDMRVHPDFLQKLLCRFGAPDLFAVTARIEMDGAHIETGRTRIFEKRGALRLQQVQVTGGAPAIPVAWAGGGSSAFDARKLRALGGFESLYAPCYGEDVSLSWLAWKRGWRIELAEDAVVHHAHRGTSVRVFGERGVERLVRSHGELFFWRAITEPVLCWKHALWEPWNAWKVAKRTGLTVQIIGLLPALPRMPLALWLRERERILARRTDSDVLRLANDVNAHADLVGGRPARTTVLWLSSEGAAWPFEPIEGVDVEEHALEVPPVTVRPLEDWARRIPEAFWASDRDGIAREHARELLRERFHDAVVFGDLHALAAARPWLGPRPAAMRGARESTGADPYQRELTSRIALISAAADLQALLPDSSSDA